MALPHHLRNWRELARQREAAKFDAERRDALRDGGWRFGLWRSRNRRLISSRRFTERR